MRLTQGRVFRTSRDGLKIGTPEFLSILFFLTRGRRGPEMWGGGGGGFLDTGTKGRCLHLLLRIRSAHHRMVREPIIS